MCYCCSTALYQSNTIMLRNSITTWNKHYEYTEISKPQPVTSRSGLQSANPSDSASQSLLLVRILLLLNANIVPLDDQKCKCFLLLSKIVDLAMTSWSSSDLCTILQVTIEEHRQCFIEMYTADAVTPKFHFLCHYPRQILNVGPKIRMWNMCNEASLIFLSWLLNWATL